MADLFKRDLKLVFGADGQVDLASPQLGLETVEGLDNLQQALTLRLLVDQGELAALAHPLYGSRVRDLIGEPLDAPNLELLRRYVRKALLRDPRVADVTSVAVGARRDAPGVVEVEATVRPASAQQVVQVRVEVDVG